MAGPKRFWLHKAHGLWELVCPWCGEGWEFLAAEQAYRYAGRHGVLCYADHMVMVDSCE
jgi:hypothetical protein